VLVLALALAACRGGVSADPPIHVIADMDYQPKYRPEAESRFFRDGRAMRLPPEGTVARGELREDEAFHTGKADGQYAAQAPVKWDESLLARGRERFQIFCTPCHGQTGEGRGIVVARGYPVAGDLTSERLRQLPDGQLFETMSKGLRNMPALGVQVPVEDRWAVVSWIRVLQRSQHATLDDVPADRRDRVEPEAP